MHLDLDIKLIITFLKQVNGFNGAFDYNELNGQNLFTASSMPEAALSIYSHRGFFCAVPEQANCSKMYFLRKFGSFCEINRKQTIARKLDSYAAPRNLLGRTYKQLFKVGE